MNNKRLRFSSFIFRVLQPNWDVVVVVAVLVSFAIRLLIPSYFAYGAVHDDELMVRTAGRILYSSEYTWDQFAIQKEPGYPYVLALLLKFEISPVIFVHILYVFSTFWLYLSLRTLIHKSIAAFCVIGILLNPGFFGIGGSRIYNVSFQTALIVGLCAAMLGLVVSWESQRRVSQRVILSSTGLVVALSWMSITRPDFLLIAYPILGVFAIWSLIAPRRVPKDWRFYCAILLVMVVIPFMSKAVVRQINSSRYGVQLVNDVNEGNFKEMMEVLASVTAGKQSKFVVVSNAALQEVARQSQTFSQLTPFFLSRDAELWRSITCDAGGKCDEIAGGYLPLMLRDGIVETFNVTDAQDFQRVTGRIVSEVQNACNSEKLQCEGRGVGAWLPSITRFDLRLTFSEFCKLLVGRTFSFSDRLFLSGTAEPSHASSDALSTWNRLREDAWGSKGVTANGTPKGLRPIITHLLSTISLILRLFAIAGTFLFVVLGLRRAANLDIVRIGAGMMLAVLALTSFYALMYANSFGTHVDGGNLAYLLMAQPVALIVASFGMHLLANQIRWIQNHKLSESFFS